MTATSLPTIRDDVQLQARALGDPTRFRIFRYLFEARRPVGVAELTGFIDLNHNAVRQHLDVLERARLVVETLEERTRPGRPRLMYTPAAGVAGLWGAPGAYEYLATLLSEAIRTGSSPEEVGRSAGRRRAEELVRGSGKKRDDSLSLVVGEMARIGFQPKIRHRARSVELVLENCPFETAAVGSPDVVCCLHRGLAEGFVEALGGLAVESLVAKNPRRAGCRLVMREVSAP